MENAPTLPLDQLTDLVEQSYAQLSQQTLPRILEQAHALAADSIQPLTTQLEQFETRLATHQRREAELFFPAVRQLAEADTQPCGEAPCRFCTVGHSAFLMEQEHEALQSLLDGLQQQVETAASLQQQIVDLSTAFAQLFQLENEILIARALRLERQLKGLPAIEK